MQPLKTMLFVCRRHVIRIFRCACYVMNYSNSTKKVFWHFPSTNVSQALHNLLTTTYMVFFFPLVDNTQCAVFCFCKIGCGNFGHREHVLLLAKFTSESELLCSSMFYDFVIRQVLCQLQFFLYSRQVAPYERPALSKGYLLPEGNISSF